MRLRSASRVIPSRFSSRTIDTAPSVLCIRYERVLNVGTALRCEFVCVCCLCVRGVCVYVCVLHASGMYECVCVRVCVCAMCVGVR